MRENLEETSQEKTGKPDTISPMDEIKKAKELLDDGAITPEEFEDIKKSIYDLLILLDGNK